jgi:hypothetical protein
MPELDGIKATGQIVTTRGLEQVRVAQFTAERIAAQVAEDQLAVLTQREREVLASRRP